MIRSEHGGELLDELVCALQCEMFTREQKDKGKMKMPRKGLVAVHVRGFGPWEPLADLVPPTLPGCYEIAYPAEALDELRPVYFGQAVNLHQRLRDYKRGVFDRREENVKQATFTKILKSKPLYARLLVLDHLIVDREPIEALRPVFPREKDVLDFVEHGVLQVVNFPLNAVLNKGYRDRGPYALELLDVTPEVREDLRLLSRLVGHVGKLVPFL